MNWVAFIAAAGFLAGGLHGAAMALFWVTIAGGVFGGLFCLLVWWGNKAPAAPAVTDRQKKGYE